MPELPNNIIISLGNNNKSKRIQLNTIRLRACYLGQNTTSYRKNSNKTSKETISWIKSKHKYIYWFLNKNIKYLAHMLKKNP